MLHAMTRYYFKKHMSLLRKDQTMTHIMCGFVLRDQRLNKKSLHHGAPVLQELVRYAIM